MGNRQRLFVGHGYGRVNVEGPGSAIWCLRGINSAWSRCREKGSEAAQRDGELLYEAIKAQQNKGREGMCLLTTNTSKG